MKRRPPKLPTSGKRGAAPAPAVPQPPALPVVAEAAGVERTRAFLDQAAGIVAIERGINAKSRVKLAAIARDLGLSDAELEVALQTLQRGQQAPQLTAEQAQDLRRRERKFHNHVGETLAALPQGVLTASMEHMLLSAGVDEYRLDKEAAQRQILELVQKLRVRRITADEAQRHIAEMVDAKISPAGVLADDVRARIFAEASRWGLTPDQVVPLVDERIRHARLAQRTQQRRRVLVAASAAALLVAVLGTLGVLALAYAFPSNRTPDSEIAAPNLDDDFAGSARSHDGPTHRSMTATLDVPDWWKGSLQKSAGNAVARIPSWREDFNKLKALSESDRSMAYTNIFASIRREQLTRDQHAVLAGLLAAAYALDPAEDCARTIREELLATAGGPREALGESMQPWEAALWAADTICAALVDENLPDARGAALAAEFQRQFSTSLAREAPAQLSGQVQSAVAARLYGTLAAAARSQPEVAVEVHEQLLPLIDDQLETAARDQLQADYLLAVLPALGERWVIYEDLIRRTVYSDDPLNVLKMLELCERTTDVALQGYLMTQLALRTGLPRVPRTLPDLAAAVREALGATGTVRPVDTKERLALWRTAAAAALAKDVPPGAASTESLQQTIEFARLSALGAALAAGEAAGPQFDALWKETAPRLKLTTDAAPRESSDSARLNTTQLKNLERAATMLRGYSRLQPLQRMNYVRAVKFFEDSLPDVLPAQGQDIASYLTAPKAVDEHEQLLPLSEGILRWPMVRVALAEQLDDARLREEHLLELVSKALRRDFTAEEGWRDKARVAILADVARELESKSGLTAKEPPIPDQASAAMAGYWRTQAQLAGSGTGEVSDTTLPSAGLLALVNAQRAKLSTASLPATRQLVDRLPQELAVADYLAASDLAQAVQLERVLVSLSAAEALIERPAAAEQVATIQRDYRDDDRRAADQVAQLLASERALLALWLVHNE